MNTLTTDLFGEEAPVDRTSWRGQYAVLATKFFRDMPIGQHFNGEELRTFMMREGLGEAAHPNQWGRAARTVLGEWFETGSIVRAGGSPAQSAKAHGRYYPRYKKIAA